jgi:hypothetical protein
VREAYLNRDAVSFLVATPEGTARLGLATGCINPGHDPFVVYQFAVIDEAVLRESGVDPQIKHRIAEPFWRGDLTAAREAASDALLDGFALAGTASDVIARLEAYAGAGVRSPILQPIAATTPEVRRIIDVGREFARSTSPAGRTPHR